MTDGPRPPATRISKKDSVLAGMEFFDQGRANAFMMGATELLIRYNII